MAEEVLARTRRSRRSPSTSVVCSAKISLTRRPVPYAVMRIAGCLGECTAASRRSTSAVLRSVLTVEGMLEMDTSVMAGETLAAGAVGVVSGVVNPVGLARAVLVESRVVLLVGEAAAALAERPGSGTPR